MVLSSVANDTEEKADQKITAAKASLQKKMDARDGLANARALAEKEATDEREREMQMVAKEFLLQIAAADTEIQQEKQKLEDAEKDLAVQLEKTNVALASAHPLSPSQTGT